MAKAILKKEGDLNLLKLARASRQFNTYRPGVQISRLLVQHMNSRYIVTVLDIDNPLRPLLFCDLRIV